MCKTQNLNGKYYDDIINKRKRKYVIHSAIHPVSIAEADCMHRIKPVLLFNHMQELAAAGIEKYDIRYGWESLLKQGYAWFLIRYRVEFDSFPTRCAAK